MSEFLDIPPILATSISPNIAPAVNSIATATAVLGGPLTATAILPLPDLSPPIGSESSNADKRLSIIRPRSAKTLYTAKGQDFSKYTSDRGVITTMKLLKRDGFDPYKLVGSGGNGVDIKADVASLLSGSFINFFVTDFGTTYSEKTQIMQTFGDNEVVYYFGKQPIIMSIRGLLFDSIENDWFSKFLLLYRDVIRGTQLAKNFGLVQISFPNMIVTGTISEFSHQQNSARDTDIPFSMQFIVKDLIPLPATLPSGRASNIRGNLIDFRANRQGVAGYTLSSGSLGGGFLDPITKIVDNGNNLVGTLTGVSDIVGGALNGFRTSIFTPVFGIVSSITKIVKTATGNISSIISSFTNPVNQILRDITNISTQATSLALLVESSVNRVVDIPLRSVTNFQNTIRSLKSSAGTVARVPENVSQTLQRLSKGGYVKKGSAVLSSGKNRNKSKSAVLSSGASYQPNKSNNI